MPRKTEAAGLSRASTVRFNEAAARCRGKRTAKHSGIRKPLCFNEAAARCRGKRCRQGHCGPLEGRFNEAAARCRGKHIGVFRVILSPLVASMRPRPDAAENRRD